MDAVVVERSQVNRRKGAALETFCKFFATQKALERVSLALRLDQVLVIAIERSRLRKHAIDRAHNFGTVGNRAHTRLELADKKFTDVLVMAERVFRFRHVELVIASKGVASDFAQERDA